MMYVFVALAFLFGHTLAATTITINDYAADYTTVFKRFYIQNKVEIKCKTQLSGGSNRITDLVLLKRQYFTILPPQMSARESIESWCDVRSFLPASAMYASPSTAWYYKLDPPTIDGTGKSATFSFITEGARGADTGEYMCSAVLTGPANETSQILQLRVNEAPSIINLNFQNYSTDTGTGKSFPYKWYYVRGEIIKMINVENTLNLQVSFEVKGGFKIPEFKISIGREDITKRATVYNITQYDWGYSTVGCYRAVRRDIMVIITINMYDICNWNAIKIDVQIPDSENPAATYEEVGIISTTCVGSLSLLGAGNALISEPLMTFVMSAISCLHLLYTVTA